MNYKIFISSFKYLIQRHHPPTPFYKGITIVFNLNKFFLCQIIHAQTFKDNTFPHFKVIYIRIKGTENYDKLINYFVINFIVKIAISFQLKQRYDSSVYRISKSPTSIEYICLQLSKQMRSLVNNTTKRMGAK